MFGNLLRIAAAPVRIIDAVVVKPVADLAEAAGDAFEEMTK